MRNQMIPRVVFRLGERVFRNESNCPISLIGEGDAAALYCITDKVQCCASQHLGEFYYPDGSLVNIRASGDSFYSNRGVGYIRLNRRNGAISPRERYKCVIPDSNGVEKIACINIVEGEIAHLIKFNATAQTGQPVGTWSGSAPTCQGKNPVV